MIVLIISLLYLKWLSVIHGFHLQKGLFVIPSVRFAAQSVSGCSPIAGIIFVMTVEQTGIKNERVTGPQVHRSVPILGIAVN